MPAEPARTATEMLPVTVVFGRLKTHACTLWFSKVAALNPLEVVMRKHRAAVPGIGIVCFGFLFGAGFLFSASAAEDAGRRLSDGRLDDAVEDVQTPRRAAGTRPEQGLDAHDRSAVFVAPDAAHASSAFKNQPDQGKMLGFEFARDPLNAKAPMQTFQETMKADIDALPEVKATQRALLDKRYDLTPRLDPVARMSRGKPLPVGPAARFAGGLGRENSPT